jgi:protein-tyrosine phosphatase
MASVLVVCTGNVCRSPIAEGMLREAFRRRLGDDAPTVASAGTAGWEGSPADPASISAAARLGVDISAHRARRLTAGHVEQADLLLTMAADHREDVIALLPRASARTFTLKELVRLLEELPPVEAGSLPPEELLAVRVRQADDRRRSGVEADGDEDVPDPLGMPPRVFRRVAAELSPWCERLADELFGAVSARAAVERR